MSPALGRVDGGIFGEDEEAFFVGGGGEFEGGVAEELPEVDAAVFGDEGAFAVEVVGCEGVGAVGRRDEFADLLSERGGEG